MMHTKIITAMASISSLDSLENILFMNMAAVAMVMHYMRCISDTSYQHRSARKNEYIIIIIITSYMSTSVNSMITSAATNTEIGM